MGVERDGRPRKALAHPAALIYPASLLRAAARAKKLLHRRLFGLNGNPQRSRGLPFVGRRRVDVRAVGQRALRQVYAAPAETKAAVCETKARRVLGM